MKSYPPVSQQRLNTGTARLTMAPPSLGCESTKTICLLSSFPNPIAKETSSDTFQPPQQGICRWPSATYSMFGKNLRQRCPRTDVELPHASPSMSFHLARRCPIPMMEQQAPRFRPQPFRQSGIMLSYSLDEIAGLVLSVLTITHSRTSRSRRKGTAHTMVGKAFGGVENKSSCQIRSAALHMHTQRSANSGSSRKEGIKIASDDHDMTATGIHISAEGKIQLLPRLLADTYRTHSSIMDIVRSSMTQLPTLRKLEFVIPLAAYKPAKASRGMRIPLRLLGHCGGRSRVPLD